MAKFKPQFRRLLFIDEKIRTGTRVGNYPNCRKLAEEYEVSAKTIQRDIDYLKWQLSAPIAYDRVKHGFYYTEPDFKLPALNISRSDLFAMCIAERVLQQYEHTPLHDKLAVVFDKLQESMPENVSINPAWLQDRFSFFRLPSPRIQPEVWNTVFEGLRQERTIQFDYQIPGKSRAHRRTVDPYHAVSYRAQWYLFGRCHYVKKIRSFAVSRMASAAVTADYFFIPSDFDFEKIAGKHFGIMFGDEEYHVKVRFGPEQAPYVREREWQDDQQLEECDDGAVVLSFSTNHLWEVRSWILSWGAGATVLEPPELVSLVQESLMTAVKNYNKKQA